MLVWRSSWSIYNYCAYNIFTTLPISTLLLQHGHLELAVKSTFISSTYKSVLVTTYKYISFSHTNHAHTNHESSVCTLVENIDLLYVTELYLGAFCGFRIKRFLVGGGVETTGVLVGEGVGTGRLVGEGVWTEGEGFAVILFADLVDPLEDFADLPIDGRDDGEMEGNDEGVELCGSWKIWV